MLCSVKKKALQKKLSNFESQRVLCVVKLYSFFLRENSQAKQSFPLRLENETQWGWDFHLWASNFYKKFLELGKKVTVPVVNRLFLFFVGVLVAGKECSSATEQEADTTGRCTFIKKTRWFENSLELLLFVVDENAFLTRRNSTTQKKRVFLRYWYDSELVFGKQHLVLGKQSYRFLGKK